ncbi:unnamed protein product, partial [Onchocerca flexuosa]|uniref:PKS_AT domain-containing protein n=1 Tax=Onchocerca flexuosa TaxID=387005 RepID=A0A183HSN5_9BILA
KIPEDIEISAILRSDLKCLIGKPEIIDELKKKLEKNEIHHRELATNYGFHCSFMDSILEEFAQFLKNFTFRKPTKQILSNIDGQLITHFDSKYMVKHMRSAIRIDKCIENLHNRNIKVIVEIGPKGIVESLLKDNSSYEIDVISTLPSKKQHEKGYDTGNLLAIATKLWMKGYNELNWEKICGNYGFDRFLPNYQFEKDICWDNQIQKANIEKPEISLYEPCWIPCKFSTLRRLSKGVLLFLPVISTKSINALLTMLHNLFIPVRCIFNDNLSSKKNLNIINDNIYINSSKEESYQQLADYLRSINFHYDTIIHAWNLSANDEIDRIDNSPHLFSSFYSIYWILANVTQNMIDLRFLACIDWNSEPELFTILGPIRELAMTRQLTKAACILCTSEVNLFEALQLLESSQANFALIRNSMNNEFEHFSYQ